MNTNATRSQPHKMRFIDGGDIYSWKHTDQLEEYIVVILRDKTADEDGNGTVSVRLSLAEAKRLARGLLTLTEQNP